MPITFSPHTANGPARIVIGNDRRKPYEDALAALGSDCVSVLPQYDADGEWIDANVGCFDFALYDLGGADGPAKWLLVSRSPDADTKRTRQKNLSDLDEVRRALAKRGVYGPVPGPDDPATYTLSVEWGSCRSMIVGDHCVKATRNIEFGEEPWDLSRNRGHMSVPLLAFLFPRAEGGAWRQEMRLSGMCKTLRKDGKPDWSALRRIGLTASHLESLISSMEADYRYTSPTTLRTLKGYRGQV